MEQCVRSHGSVANLCLDLLDKTLNAQNMSVWRHILKTETKVFEICNEIISEQSLDAALKSLADLRESENCFCGSDIDMVISIKLF